MAKVFSEGVSGTIISSSIFQPKEGQKGKTHVRIEILQLSDSGTNVVVIKDTELSNFPKYPVGSRFCCPCTITNYSMGGNDGLSIYVFHGVQSELPFSLNSALDVPKTEKIRANI